jgi:hypothetical protein
MQNGNAMKLAKNGTPLPRRLFKNKKGGWKSEPTFEPHPSL